MRYKVKAKGKDGYINKILTADNKESLKQLVKAERLTLISYEEMADEDNVGKFKNKKSARKQKIKLHDIIFFTEEFASLEDSGVSRIEALTELKNAIKNNTMKEAIQTIIDGLLNGKPLPDAMAETGIFSDFYISMIDTGEATGTLSSTMVNGIKEDGILQSLSDALIFQDDMKRKVKSAVRYPSFVIIAMAAAVVILNMFVIPAFRKVFAQFKAELPWQTKMLIETSDFFVNYWYVIIGVIVGMVFTFIKWKNTEKGKLKWDTVKLKLPLFGHILEKIALARFAKTLAITQRAGLGIEKSLRITQRTVDNSFYAEKIEEIIMSVNNGNDLHVACAGTGVFSDLLLIKIKVGATTGKIDEQMKKIAVYYEKEINASLEGLTSAIEPIMMMFMGGLVLVMALGIFLPMWNLTSVMTKHSKS